MTCITLRDVLPKDSVLFYLYKHEQFPISYFPLPETESIFCLCNNVHCQRLKTEFFPQLLEAETLRHIFMNNYQLCNEISDRVVHHFVHCIETHGRHVQYLKFLQTIVKADGKYVKKCQDKVMTEVRSFL